MPHWRAVTSRSCEVVRYSRATRGDENARAGRGEDARGGEVRAAGCLRLELVGDAAASVMDVAEAELAAAGAALADLAFVAVHGMLH